MLMNGARLHHANQNLAAETEPWQFRSGATLDTVAWSTSKLKMIVAYGEANRMCGLSRTLGTWGLLSSCFDKCTRGIHCVRGTFSLHSGRRFGWESSSSLPLKDIHLIGRTIRVLEVSLAFCQATGALVWWKIVAILALESGRWHDFLSRAFAMLCGESQEKTTAMRRDGWTILRLGLPEMLQQSEHDTAMAKIDLPMCINFLSFANLSNIYRSGYV